MIGQIRFMRDKGFEVHVASGPGPELDYMVRTEKHTGPPDKDETRAISTGRFHSASTALFSFHSNETDDRPRIYGQRGPFIDDSVGHSRKFRFASTPFGA